MQKLSDSLNLQISQLDDLKIISENPILSDDKRKGYNETFAKFMPIFNEVQAAANKLWVVLEKKLNRTDEEED